MVNRVDFINAGIELAITRRSARTNHHRPGEARNQPIVADAAEPADHQGAGDHRVAEERADCGHRRLHHDEESLPGTILGDIPLLGELFRDGPPLEPTRVQDVLTGIGQPDQRTVVAWRQDDRFPIAIETLELPEPVNW